MHEIAMQWVDVFKALLTPVIALIATYIAIQQYRIEQAKSKLERYDRRLAVYKAVHRFLSDVVQAHKVEPDDIRRLHVDTTEAGFLFGKDIPDYIHELALHGVRLVRAYHLLKNRNDRPPDYDHDRVVQTNDDEMIWMYEQFDVAERKFAKYLKVT